MAETYDHSDAAASEAMTLEGVLDRLQRVRDGGKVSVDDILTAFGPRAFGPLLLVPALIAVLPVIGALPGVSWGCAGLVTLVSLQFVLSSRKMWLPRFLARARMDDATFDSALERTRPWLRRMDRLFGPRLQALMHPVMIWLTALLCLLLGLAMFVFSLVPGGIVIPSLAVLLIAVALTTRDGLMLLLGVVLSGVVLPLVFTGAFRVALNAFF